MTIALDIIVKGANFPIPPAKPENWTFIVKEISGSCSLNSVSVMEERGVHSSVNSRSRTDGHIEINVFPQ